MQSPPPERRAEPSTFDFSAVAALLVAWHEAHQRVLPWRGERAGARPPYDVWVAEIMLQQTRVEVVQTYYRRWMERFPTLQALADADLADVLKQWEGLGYYARARYLHQAARLLVAQHGGRFPESRARLLRLPGIGEYSAGALLSIAFGQREPLLDGNVKRVLARLADIDQPVEAGATLKQLWALARAVVEAAPDGDAGVLNEALIELGATVCAPRRPRCALCPLGEVCLARQRGTQEARPVRASRRDTPHYDVAAGVIWQGEAYASHVLIAQRPLSGLLGGLWEFPGGKMEASDASLEAALAREIAEELGIAIVVGEKVAEVRHAFTHFRITLHAFHARHDGGEPAAIGCADWRWVELGQLGEYPMGVADRRVAARVVAQFP